MHHGCSLGFGSDRGWPHLFSFDRRNSCVSSWKLCMRLEGYDFVSHLVLLIFHGCRERSHLLISFAQQWWATMCATCQTRRSQTSDIMSPNRKQLDCWGGLFVSWFDAASSRVYFRLHRIALPRPAASCFSHRNLNQNQSQIVKFDNLA